VAVGVDGVSQVLNRVVVAADAASAAQEILQAAGFSTTVVVVNGNVAVLTGTVDAEEEALAAADLVLGLPGIDKVDNRLIIGPGTS
jgi:osmotically-inducible protein OsmY